MNITVSKIKRRAVRRLAILCTFPLAAVGALAISLWNAAVDIVFDQAQLALSAVEQWRK